MIVSHRMSICPASSASPLEVLPADQARVDVDIAQTLGAQTFEVEVQILPRHLRIRLVLQRDGTSLLCQDTCPADQHPLLPLLLVALPHPRFRRLVVLEAVAGPVKVELRSLVEGELRRSHTAAHSRAH